MNAQILITRDQQGNYSLQNTVPDHALFLGMLEIAKLIFVQQTTAKAQQGPKLVVPPPGMNGDNLRGR